MPSYPNKAGSEGRRLLSMALNLDEFIDSGRKLFVVQAVL